MNGFALDTNIVSAHLRGDVQVGAMIKATTRLYFLNSDEASDQR